MEKNKLTEKKVENFAIIMSILFFSIFVLRNIYYSYIELSNHTIDFETASAHGSFVVVFGVILAIIMYLMISAVGHKLIENRKKDEEVNDSVRNQTGFFDLDN